MKGKHMSDATPESPSGYIKKGEFVEEPEALFSAEWTKKDEKILIAIVAVVGISAYVGSKLGARKPVKTFKKLHKAIVEMDKNVAYNAEISFQNAEATYNNGLFIQDVIQKAGMAAAKTKKLKAVS